MRRTVHDVSLIVFDVDGTLLDDDQGLGEKTIMVLRQLQEKGIAISLATGKIFPSVANLIMKLNIQVPLVLANGGIIQKPNKQIVYGEFLDPEVIDQITRNKKRFGAEMALFMPDNIFVEKETFNTEHITVEFKEKIQAIGRWSIVRDYFSHICKAIWINRVDNQKLALLSEFLKQSYDGRISLVTGSPESIEAIPLGVSKRAGLIRLIEYLNIPLRSVMVFGDQQNDIGMLEAAGVAVAVGNAIEKVKAISDHVVGTNNEQGPAGFLIKYFGL